MLASMYSAVSGLSVHQTKMNVIGNNVSNVNTYGFKSSRVTFSDVFYQSYSGASAPTTTTGGTNSSQLGYGASLGTIDVLSSRGGSASTDRSLDVYINGDGYLPVQDSSGNTLYTRLGNLYFDVAGNLVDGSGNKVLGLTWDENGVVQLGEDGTATTSSLQAISVEPEVLKELTSISIGTGGQITAIQEGAPQVNLSSGTSWIANTAISDKSNYSGTFRMVSATPAGAALINSPEEGKIKATGLDARTATVLTTSVKGTDPSFAVTGPTAPADLEAAADALKTDSGKTTGTYTFTYNSSGKWDITDENGDYVKKDLSDTDLSTNYKITVAGTASPKDTFKVEQIDHTALSGDIRTNSSNQLVFKDPNGNERTADLVTSDTTGDPYKYTFEVPVSFTDGNATTVQVEIEVAKAYADANINGFDLGTITPKTVDMKATVYEKSGQTKELTGTWDSSSTTGNVTLGDITLTIDPKKFGTMDMTKLENKQLGNVGSGDGTVITIGQLALATFTNQDGLVQEGSGYYTISSNSGAATISVPGNNGTGTTVASSLEMSNVDLASEFTEMIFAERGFQANSRVITTSDTLLEELVNLVR